MEILCSRCGAAMRCTPEGGCWCAELPRVVEVPLDGDAGCLCRECLGEEIAGLKKKPGGTVVPPVL